MESLAMRKRVNKYDRHFSMKMNYIIKKFIQVVEENNSDRVLSYEEEHEQVESGDGQVQEVGYLTFL